uniref:cilia- and flagella-associated protein 251-like isoform X2 n=1 Tax=Myxine glutinosa TaxID=7769 RepID=UPI00358ECCF4
MENMQQENALRGMLRQTFRIWPLSYVAALIEKLSGALLQAFPDSPDDARSPKSPNTERRVCHGRKRLSNIERLLSRLLPSWILEFLLGIPSPSSFGNPSSSDEIKASPGKLFGKGSKRKQEAVLEEEEEEDEYEDEIEMEEFDGSDEELLETLGCSVETVLQNIENVMAAKDEQEKEECRKEDCAVKAFKQTDAAEKELSENVKRPDIEVEPSTSERQSRRDVSDKEEGDYHAVEEVVEEVKLLEEKEDGVELFGEREEEEEEEEDEDENADENKDGEFDREEKTYEQFKASFVSSDLPEEDCVEDPTYEPPQLESSDVSKEGSSESAEEESQMPKGADKGMMSQTDAAEKEFDNVKQPEIEKETSTGDGQSRRDESREDDLDMEDDDGELNAEEKAYEQFKASFLSGDPLPEEDCVEDPTYEDESSDEDGKEESESADEESKMLGEDEGILESSESQNQESKEDIVYAVGHTQLPLRVGPIGLSGSATTEKQADDSSTEGEDGMVESEVKPGISNGHSTDSQIAVMEENPTEGGMDCFDGKKSAGGEEKPAFNVV